MKLLVYVLFLITVLAWARSEKCSEITYFKGKIEDHLNAYTQERCWLIEVPFNYYISLDFQYLQFETEGYNGVEIIEVKTGRNYTIDRTDKVQALAFQSNVQIIHYARNSGSRCWSKFELNFEISKLPVRGVKESLESTVSWLYEHPTSSKEWEDNIPRAIIALYLASAANFNGWYIDEKLTATQLALDTAVALLRSPITNNRLSMLVSALLVSCYDPRHFYGKNLVKLLKTQVEATLGFTHPLPYLTLCNANETWPSKALNDLNNVLSTNSDYAFVRDIQALAMLAISCIKERNNIMTEGSNISVLYNETISRFKSFQHEDGSFGNSHTTALITQVLIADNEENTMMLKTTVEYLMRELNTSNKDFLSVYLTLPILNRKTLADISNKHCLSSPINHGNDIVTEVNNRSGPKMRVWYSLYVGDEKDVIHTISLRVPNNFTAYEVMEIAQIEDQKYKFEVKTVSGKLYVYKIANITNDPVAGKFWLQYVSLTNNTSNLTNFYTNTDELTMNNEQHLVMWYKTANI